MSELSRRVIVSLIGAPIALFVLWYGGAPLSTLISCLSAIAAWELFRIARAAGNYPISPVGIVLAAIIPLLVQAQQLNLIRVPYSLLVVVLLLVIALVLFMRSPAEKPLTAAAITVFGAVYTGGLLSFGYSLRYFDYAVGDAAGAVVVAFPLLLAWGTDIGAFTFGKLMGGKKLMPSISPGKTVSGAIGGIVTTVIVAWLYQKYALIPVAQLAFRPMTLVAVALLISLVGQIGDLFESQLKREANVKDSSNLIPGHGGVLDRLDSVLFTFPVAYVLFKWLVVAVPT